MSRHRCPKCQSSECLYEEVMVPGWRSVNDELEPIGRGASDRDVEWSDALSDEMFGCGECNWHGSRRQLENLGIDGQPLPAIHPAQTELVPETRDD